MTKKYILCKMLTRVNKGVYMISLHRLELEDKAWIDPLVMAENTQSADFSFGSMLIWNEAFIQYVGRFCDRLIG